MITFIGFLTAMLGLDQLNAFGSNYRVGPKLGPVIFTLHGGGLMLAGYYIEWHLWLLNTYGWCPLP